MSAAIVAIAWHDPRCAPLVAEGEAGDGPFLRRLRDEGSSGACRFERPGEFLLAAEEGGELLAVGGVSLDPYHPADGLGRVRHVYVLEAQPPRHRPAPGGKDPRPVAGQVRAAAIACSAAGGRPPL